jgi:hypothetical protein
VEFKQACQVANLRGVPNHWIAPADGFESAGAGWQQSSTLSGWSPVKNLTPESVQADERFCFVGCKERRNLTRDMFRGDQYLHLAMDSKSKLIISHVIGKRSVTNAEALMTDLKHRVAGHFQLTTDGCGWQLKGDTSTRSAYVIFCLL